MSEDKQEDIVDELGEEATEETETNEEVEQSEIVSEYEAVEPDTLANELSALKEALTQEVDEDDRVEAGPDGPISKVHELHDKLGMAGSRNAFPLQEEPQERKGQRKGMFIGLPNRFHRKHLKPAVEKLGDGAFKIDDDRPVNN